MLNPQTLGFLISNNCFRIPKSAFCINAKPNLESLIPYGRFAKLSENLQANGLAFFRMELKRNNIILPDRRGELNAILRS